MATSVPRFTEFPTEILEQILQHLPGQDVVKMEMVRPAIATPHHSALTSCYVAQISRQFQDLTRSSPILQYKRNLFSAGFTDNPCNPCDFAQRRKAYEEYERKWSDAGSSVRAIHKLPEKISPKIHPTMALGRNLIALRGTPNVGSLTFLRLPPATSAKPIERWYIPPLPFELNVFAAYPPDNILAVTEAKNRCVYLPTASAERLIMHRSVSVHLLNLSDGSPYSAPPSNVITWDAPPGPDDDVYVRWLAITSSRVAIHFRYWGEFRGDDAGGRMGKILVWDWKTGNLVKSVRLVWP